MGVLFLFEQNSSTPKTVVCRSCWGVAEPAGSLVSSGRSGALAKGRVPSPVCLCFTPDTRQVEGVIVALVTDADEFSREKLVAQGGTDANGRLRCSWGGNALARWWQWR